MSEFFSRDPLLPAFWDERFEQAFTPWDRGDVPEQLRVFVEAQPKPWRTLIPGCGSAYELAFLSDYGWDATAIDFSPAAVSAARTTAGVWQDRVLEADFFTWTHAQQLDLIYERAFLCALPRTMWGKVAARWAELLAPGGLLAGYFFFDDVLKGPPYGIEETHLQALLTPHFELVEELAVDDSIPVFIGKERWQVWRRK